MRTADGTTHQSNTTATIHLDTTPPLTAAGYVIPNFPHTLLSVGKIVDENCRVLFDNHKVSVLNKSNRPILTGWREASGSRLWRIPITENPNPQTSPSPTHIATNAYTIPTTKELIAYYHAAAGYPVKSTWLAAIKAGNYATWPGLTTTRASKHYPDTIATPKGHMISTRQGLRSTTKTSENATMHTGENRTHNTPTGPACSTTHNIVHINTSHINKLYTDDTGRFPIRSHSGNQYLMIAYHQPSNAILVEPFQSRRDVHRITAYNNIMTRINNNNHQVDLQILDNEASTKYKNTITTKWNVTYQLVPPHTHRRNTAERAIRTFKAHFLSILAGVDTSYPRQHWDLLLPHAELTLNLLRQSNQHPSISAYHHFYHSPFSYNAHPLGPIGAKVLIHTKPAVRHTWEYRCQEGWYLGTSLEHYRCHRVLNANTLRTQISDTIAFTKHVPCPPIHAPPRVHNQPPNPVPIPDPKPNPNPNPTPAPRVHTSSKPKRFVADRTPDHHHRSKRGYLHSAFPVLDADTGEVLEYRQLRKHPKHTETWTTSYANELGRLCQGIGRGTQGPSNQRVAGTNTFRPIPYLAIPANRRPEITFTKVVCSVRPDKADPHRTRITVGGNRINYPHDVGTPTGSLEIFKLLINSILSTPHAKFASFDIKNFYLNTPLTRKEYTKINLSDIPAEFVNEYNLTSLSHNGWIHFEILKGVYGLPQAGRLANDLLRQRLNHDGYNETTTTPGLWKHKSRPIIFVLTVDDFAIQYVGKENALHLEQTLNKHYETTTDWIGSKFAGINLKWNYHSNHSQRSCHLSMPGYIQKILIKYQHPTPTKKQLSPHPHLPINYGSKTQLASIPDDSPTLPQHRIKRIQGIVGALLYYARAVDNKILTALNAIAARQANATETTEQTVNHLLDYCATYPNDGTTYHESKMILCAHSDAGFNNETNGRSRVGSHIFLSDNSPRPPWNGAILSIAQILKFVLSSAAEAELGALFVTAKEMIPLRQALNEMGWPQPPSPIQTDNSTASGVVNNKIVPRKLKAMDLRYHWLRCRQSQNQFRFYWAPGQQNWADYHTKHHPPIYHESHRPLFAKLP